MIRRQFASRHPKLQLLNLARKFFRRIRIWVEGVCGQTIGTWRTADAQIDAARRNSLEHAKLFRYFESRIMRQHDPGTADANAPRRRCDRGNQNLRRRADDAAAVVMFRNPVALIA